MDDAQIVELYWNRSEEAIRETDRKYGGCCFSVAYNILANREDAEESVNDAYLKTWETVPPHRPIPLLPFLTRLTRNISISRWRSGRAAKRGGGEILLALEELEGCTAGTETAESALFYRETVRAFQDFLDALPDFQRDVFLRRYFFLDSIASIAEDFGFTQGKVKSMLHRTRMKLRTFLKREDLI